MALMPSDEQVEQDRQREIERKKARKNELVERFDYKMGSAFAEYEESSGESKSQARESFARTIAIALGGDSTSRTKAIIALLTYFDEQIEPLQMSVERQENRFGLF